MSEAGTVAAALVLAAAAALRAGLVSRHRAGPAARARALSAPAPFWSAKGQHCPASPTRTNGGGLLVAPGWFLAGLFDTAVAVAPGPAWAGWTVGGAVVTGWAAVAAGIGAGVLAAAVVGGGPFLGWRLLRHRRAAAVEAALPAAVEAVAASLRSGASLRQALSEAARSTPGALGDDLGAVATATKRGSGVVPALEGWADRRPLPGVRLVVAALCLCAETGGAAAQAVDAVAATLRQRLAAQAEARALATQARASAAVMAAAPVAFGALSAAVDPRSAAFLLRAPLGLALLAGGLALDAAGAVWMARLTRVSP